VVTGICLAIVPLGHYWNGVVEPVYPVLRTSTPVLEAGNLAQGERRILHLFLQNPHKREVLIEQVDPSCPCLRALDLPWNLSPGQQKTVPLALDLGQERYFTGSLLIEYEAKTSDRKRALRGHIRARVK
jgi:hypothetical protein